MEKVKKYRLTQTAYYDYDYGYWIDYSPKEEYYWYKRGVDYDYQRKGSVGELLVIEQDEGVDTYTIVFKSGSHMIFDSLEDIESDPALEEIKEKCK